MSNHSGNATLEIKLKRQSRNTIVDIDLRLKKVNKFEVNLLKNKLICLNLKNGLRIILIISNDYAIFCNK